MVVTDDEKRTSESSFIEEQYFGSVQEDKEEIDYESDTSKESPSVEEQYSYTESTEEDENEMSSESDPHERASYFDSQYFDNVRELKDVKRKVTVSTEDLQNAPIPDKETESQEEGESQSTKSLNFSNIDPPALLKRENQSVESIVPDGGSSAEEFAVKLRTEKGINISLNPGFGFYQQYHSEDVPYWCKKRKSPTDEDNEFFDRLDAEENVAPKEEVGTYSPPNRSLPFHLMTTADLCGFLRSSVIHRSKDFIAINKPYGLSCQGGNDSKFDIVRILPSLSRAVGVEELHAIHRLDKNTTGVLLLGRNEEATGVVKKLFQERQVDKRYIAITVGVPYPRRGLISDQIQTFYNHKSQLNKMFLVRKPSRESLDAVTRYEVIFHREQAALVECLPETGYRHQIRTHLAQSLGCPILGDHKYSTPSGHLPQVLPQEILDSFNMRAGKSRRMMMHLHASRMAFPYPTDGQHRFIDIRARLHRHFMDSMKLLKLRFPKMIKLSSRLHR